MIRVDVFADLGRLNSECFAGLLGDRCSLTVALCAGAGLAH